MLTSILAVISTVSSWIFTNIIKPFLPQILLLLLGFGLCCLLFWHGCSCHGPFAEWRKEREERHSKNTASPPENDNDRRRRRRIEQEQLYGTQSGQVDESEKGGLSKASDSVIQVR
jgi:hypothetical protein